MKRILNNQQIREADAHTIRNEPIASIELMERASEAFCNALKDTIILQPGTKVLVLCGQGNNGGDGMAIARILRGWGMAASVLLFQVKEKGSPDFEINLARWKESGGELQIIKPDDVPTAPEPEDALVIDAIFGSGLDRPLDGFFLEVVRAVNTWPQQKIAVDMPSGLFAEKALAGAEVLHADYTFTFQCYKAALLLPETGPLAGQVKVLDIGLDQGFIQQVQADYWMLEVEDLRTLLKDRPRFSHKGDFGHALLLAGSKGKVGAALLAGKACMVAGSGLLTLHLPGCAYIPAQTALPEAMVSLSAAEDFVQDFPQALDQFSVIGAGPGLGTSSDVSFMLYQLLHRYDGPIVLDADALNILAENKAWLHLLEGRALLTPHPGEFRRLAGAWRDDYEKLAKLREMAVYFRITVILKGAFSVIALPEGQLIFNPTGNPGMAKGGSGDVLTGLLTGLLAQGYSLKDAAMLGAWLHGEAGDLAAAQWGQHSMLAGHISEKVAEAYRKLKN
jgi:NAD(P)H-hydrate epimerase